MTNKTKSDGAADDGGAAFPNFEEGERYDDSKGMYVRDIYPNGGMTLRDYFAAKAMQTLLQGASAPKDMIGDLFALISKSSYQMADAMIAQRKGGTDDR